MVKTSCLIAIYTALGTAVSLVFGLGILDFFYKDLFPSNSNNQQTSDGGLTFYIFIFIVVPVAMILIVGFLVSQNERNNRDH